MNRIPYGRQNITAEDIEAVNRALKSDFLTTGPKVKEFENKFAEYVDAEYAVAVSNGTAALHLSAMALNVDKSSKVITTPITFAATANCIRYCGGQVHFCDVDPETILLSIEKVREKLESHPKGYFQGIIPVDFAGNPVDMEAFRTLAVEHNLWIIEDACHAPGGWFEDSLGIKQFCGNGKYADLAIFSFHPVKHIACGEGGMVTTNDQGIYEKLLQLRSHGMIYQGNPSLIENHGGWYMEMQELGFNYRMPDILCALGISQLSRANEGIARRKEIAEIYDGAFVDTDIMPLKSHLGHAYHLYVVQVENRRGLYDHLKANGIMAQIHYIPLHSMPYYRKLGQAIWQCNVAEDYYKKCISLPMYPTLRNNEIEFVIKSVLNFVKE